jgi:hypothetical protein
VEFESVKGRHSTYQLGSEDASPEFISLELVNHMVGSAALANWGSEDLFGAGESYGHKTN